MASESSLQAKLVQLCNKAGILAYKMRSPSRRGVPDLLLMHAGYCIFIEVKSPNGTGRLSPLQVRTHEQLESFGMSVHVVSDAAAGERLINEFAGLRPAGGYHTAD